jgi:hypothetical protein
MVGSIIVSFTSIKRPIRGYISRSSTIKMDFRFWEYDQKGLKTVRN